MNTPLVPADVDLQDFQYMPLDVRRLRDSDLAALESPEACWAAVLLWSASWHQVPAASLPDDDRVLANLAGYGRVVKEWQRVREGALRGWIKCDDGRLYHPVVAEKALEAWDSKVHHAHGKLKERLRKSYGKDAVQPTFEQWISAGKPNEWPQSSDGIPPEESQPSDGKKDSSAGIPPENPLKGEGEGKGYVNLNLSVANATSGNSASQSSPGDPTGEYEKTDQLTLVPVAHPMSCPVDRLVSLYHELMPRNPRCKVLNQTRRKAIQARWKEAADLDTFPFKGGYDSTAKGLACWREFFAICADSDFLTGKSQPTPGRPVFLADLDFLMSPSAFAKTLENKYHREVA